MPRRHLSRPAAGGRILVAAGGGASRVEPLAGGDEFDRALLRTRLASDGPTRSREIGVRGGIRSHRVAGRTDGRSWTQVLAESGSDGLSAPRGSPIPRAGATRPVRRPSSISSGWAARRRDAAARARPQPYRGGGACRVRPTGERVESASGSSSRRFRLSSTPSSCARGRRAAKNRHTVRVLVAEIRALTSGSPITFPGDLASTRGSRRS